MVFSDIPATRANDGRLCTPPAPGDAAVGLLMLALPLLAPVVWLADDETSLSVPLLAAWAVLYAAGLVVALHGFMSDLSPMRGQRRYVPTPAVALGAIYAVGLPWAVAMIVAPGDAATQEAARRGKILTTATPDPSASPTPPPSRTELWIAGGGTVGFGEAMLALAVVCALAMVAMYVRGVLSRPWQGAENLADAGPAPD